MRATAYLPVLGQSGSELLCRGIVLALDKLGVQVSIIHKDEWNMERVELDSEEKSRLVEC